MSWIVTDPKGVKYQEVLGGEIQTFEEGQRIDQRDIERGYFTPGSIEALIEAGRIVPDGDVQNKKMSGTQKKGKSKDEE